MATSLRDIRDRHKGARFLICGTGPSVDQYSADWYARWDGITIGVNDIVHLFEPDYHLNIHESARTLTCNIPGLDREIQFDYHNPSTQVDLEKKGELSLVGTVAFTAYTAAYQLGAGEISLIGVDFKVCQGQTHFIGCPSGYDGNHFIEKNFELAAVIRCFESAIKQYGEFGIKTINLSRNSLLMVN